MNKNKKYHKKGNSCYPHIFVNPQLISFLKRRHEDEIEYNDNKTIGCMLMTCLDQSYVH